MGNVYYAIVKLTLNEKPRSALSAALITWLTDVWFAIMRQFTKPFFVKIVVFWKETEKAVQKSSIWDCQEKINT